MLSEQLLIVAFDVSAVGKDLCRPECVVAAGDGTLWVNDGRRALTATEPDGSLGEREIYGPDTLGLGLADGIAFDASAISGSR